MSSPTSSTPSPAVPLGERLRRLIFGAPRDVSDPHVHHQMSLIAFLAWVGLGADGLSSSAYGPDECFRALVEEGAQIQERFHVTVDFTFLAVFLALATALTVFVISYAYSRIIEHFPSGGGGYVVATKLLGSGAGVVSGCALLVDYILTITTSVASGGDAIFSLLPLELHYIKLPAEIAILVLLVFMNLRGVKESVTALLPVFLVFVASHIVLIVGAVLTHAGAFGAIGHQVAEGLRTAWTAPHYVSPTGQLVSVGKFGVFLIFLSAYSRGGGTYTGIEAVSNGLQIMREPLVQTGKRTMVYMATSLSITAGGIILCYLLFHAAPVEGKTMNSVLVEAFAGHWSVAGIPIGKGFIWLTLISEGALLFVAAQTGFIDGPRVMANMAVDSWLPHRFATLSDRLTTKDGVLLIGGAAIALLLFTRGSVDALVVMYSINVFLTFSLSQAGMCRFWVGSRKDHPEWSRHIGIHVIGLVMCLAILVSTVLEKFRQGAWLTLVITSACIAVCVAIRTHYVRISRKLAALDSEFGELPSHDHHGGTPDARQPTAVLLVGKFGGVGIHSILSIQRSFPNYFKNMIFVSVAVVDSGVFKGSSEIERHKGEVEKTLEQYVELARRLGWNADFRTSVGIDAVHQITRICIDLAKQYPRTVFFAGKLLWKRESWFQRILHNETAYQVQRRLQWKGLPMTVLPLRVADGK